MALAAQSILQVLLARLRVTYVSEAAFSDSDVLAFLNDAYLDACQATRCLKTLTTITTVANQREYVLPADLDEVIAVATNGVLLNPVPIDRALQDVEFLTSAEVGYYVYGTIFGLVPLPDQDGQALSLLYSAVPTVLTDFGQALDARFPPEFTDVLYHWVRWRAQIMAGGAERIGSATIDRQMYELRIKELRRVADSIPQTSDSQMIHAQAPARRLVGN